MDSSSSRELISVPSVVNQISVFTFVPGWMPLVLLIV